MQQIEADISSVTMQSNWAAASIKNIRTQRQLDIELLDIERRWHLELRYLNRKRLGLIFDLNRYKNLRRNADYISASLGGKQLRQYTRVCQDRMLEQRASRRRAQKFDFDVDAVDRKSLRLPAIDVDTSNEKHGHKEKVTSSDLNLKRASFQKGVSELNQLLSRTRRRSRRKSMFGDDEEDEEEFVELFDDGQENTTIEVIPSSSSLIVPNISTRKGSMASRSLPPINEL